MRSGQLKAVAALSPVDAWAVGFSGQRSLILHWDGVSWQKVATGIKEKHSPLGGVAVTSATDAWAVGTSPARAGLTKTLIVHWNGKHWTEMRSPNGDHQQINVLNAVSATSAKDAWAVGLSEGKTEDSLILHWNGYSWQRIFGLKPGPDSSLDAVDARSAGDVLGGREHPQRAPGFVLDLHRAVGWIPVAAGRESDAGWRSRDHHDRGRGGFGQPGLGGRVVPDEAAHHPAVHGAVGRAALAADGRG